MMSGSCVCMYLNKFVKTAMCHVLARSASGYVTRCVGGTEKYRIIQHEGLSRHLYVGITSTLQYGAFVVYDKQSRVTNGFLGVCVFVC